MGAFSTFYVGHSRHSLSASSRHAHCSAKAGNDKKGHFAHNLILLIKFLDATAVFDRTSHPVILSHLFNEGDEDDQWMYFDILHGNATSHIKRNGRIPTEVIQNPSVTDKAATQA
jgi:hypothetical protein